MAVKYYFLLLLLLFFVSFFTLCKLLTIERISRFLASVTVSGHARVPPGTQDLVPVEEEPYPIDPEATIVRLHDESVYYVSHPYVSVSISVPHTILLDEGDRLDACTIRFPSGVAYDVYPNNTVPAPVIAGTSLFPKCAVSFMGVSKNMSGTYELAALTRHFDGKGTLQRQRFLLHVLDLGESRI